MTPSFRLWRSSVTVEELTDHGRALSRRGAHARVVRKLRRDAAHQPRSPKHEADFQLLRYAEHHAGLGHRRGVVAAGAVVAACASARCRPRPRCKLLDDANAAIHYNREILQTALDHVRQGIAVFDKDLQLICWNRQFGEILDLPREPDRASASASTRSCASMPSSGDVGPDRIDDLVRERVRALRRRRRAVSCERFAERGLVIEVRANHMPDGGIVTTFDRHHAERRSRRSAGTRQRDAGTARARAHRGTDAPQRRARHAPRPTPTTPTSPRRASSPPPATTFCSRSTRRGST